MRRQTSAGGLIPEQIWDAPPIPEKELYNGCPSGSAMPLVWAHAEYVKLVRSLHDGHIFDTPPETRTRYLDTHHVTAFAAWRFNNKRRAMEAGRILRVETLAPAVVHWTDDDWQTTHDDETRDTTLGLWCVDLPTDGLTGGCTVCFTFYWPQADRWEGTDFTVALT
jgi:glucoamylase